MKNGLDEQYIDLLKDILENGVEKDTRNGKTLSVFGRSIRYKFKDGKFPLITTKKMYTKGIVTELLWFMMGNTNIKFLIDNDCHIWDGDCYNFYLKRMEGGREDMIFDKETFINEIKNNNSNHFWVKQFGELGPIYGSGWRNFEGVDQISELIDGLKTNPDSRRLRVSAWQPHKVKDMALPPCHTDFQVYTRELSLEERVKLYEQKTNADTSFFPVLSETLDFHNIPTRAISLMFNMRSNDVPLGLPFNIASYALLLEIIGKMVNMVPDELIGNLGDCHIYLNQIDGVKEQIGRELRVDERICMCYEDSSLDLTRIQEGMSDLELENICNEFGIPKRTREPFPLPKLGFNKSSEFFRGLGDDLSLLSDLDISDFMVENYKSHPIIKFPLSN